MANESNIFVYKTNTWYSKEIAITQKELEAITDTRKKMSLLGFLFSKFTFFKKEEVNDNLLLCSSQDLEYIEKYQDRLLTVFDVARYSSYKYSKPGFRDRYVFLSDIDSINWLFLSELIAHHRERILTKRIKKLRGIIKKNTLLLFKFFNRYNPNSSVFIKRCTERISDKSGNEDNNIASKIRKLLLSNFSKSLHHAFNRTKTVNSEYRQSTQI